MKDLESDAKILNVCFLMQSCIFTGFDVPMTLFSYQYDTLAITYLETHGLVLVN